MAKTLLPRPFKGFADRARKIVTGTAKPSTAALTPNGSDFPPIPALNDPDTPRIDIAPADLRQSPDPPSVSDQKLVEFVMKEWKKSRDARIRIERDWRLSLDFEQGNQWVGWDERTRKFIDFVSQDPDPNRFSTTNLIRPRIETVGSMVTQAAIESQCVPNTPSDLDRQAATEGRGVLAHYNRLYKNRIQVREAVDWALSSTTCWLKSTFEPGVEVEVPEYKTVMATDPLNPSGPPVAQKVLKGATTAPEGDIVERVIPGFRIYGDPAAHRIDEWRYLFHAEVYPTSWFQERFENGTAVQPDPGGGVVTYDLGRTTTGISTAFGTGVGGVNFAGMVNKDVATCYEMWILPGKIAMFPRGAVIYVAGNQVLRPRKDADGDKPIETAWRAQPGFENDGEESVPGYSRKITTRGKRIPGNYYPWPYECKTEFPFVDLGYADSTDSAYSRSLVQDLVEPQMDYNRTRTRIRERLEKEKVLWITPKLGGLSPSDRWEDYGNFWKVPVDGRDGSGAGQLLTPPPISKEQFDILAIIERNMDDIAGIHDPNFRGDLPAGVTSGVAIQGLKQGDASRLARFGARIEEFVRRRDTWRIRHASQFFDDERLMGLDDTGNPATGKIPSSAPVPLPPVPPAQPVPPQQFGTAPNPQAPPQGPPQGQQQPPAPPPQTNTGAGADVTINPYANVLAFKALTGGGTCRILIQPGSALAETPDARNQRVMENYKEQLYGPVGSPGAAKIAVELMQDNDTDIILQRLTDLEAKQDAMAAAELAAKGPGPAPPDPMALAQLQSQLRIQENAAQAQADVQRDIAKIQAENTAKIQYLEAQYRLQQQYGPLLTSPQFKGTPAGETVLEEKMLGVGPVHEAAGHLAAVAATTADGAAAYGVPAQVHPHAAAPAPAPIPAEMPPPPGSDTEADSGGDSTDAAG